MDYCVAGDGPQRAVANAWMAAAGEKGIPAPFIVGKDGRIAWIGYPGESGRRAPAGLRQVPDVPAAKNRRDLELKMVRPLNEAMAAKDYVNAPLNSIDAIVAQQPALAHAHAYSRLIALYHTDLDAGIALSNKILTEADHEIGAYRMMASILATQTDLFPGRLQVWPGTDGRSPEKGEMTYLFLP